MKSENSSCLSENIILFACQCLYFTVGGEYKNGKKDGCYEAFAPLLQLNKTLKDSEFYFLAFS